MDTVRKVVDRFEDHAGPSTRKGPPHVSDVRWLSKSKNEKSITSSMKGKSKAGLRMNSLYSHQRVPVNVRVLNSYRRTVSTDGLSIDQYKHFSEIHSS